MLTLLQPLTDLAGSHSEWVWTEAEQSLFDRLKAALVDAPVLAILDLTKSASFVIETDASNVAIGSVLLQRLGFRTAAGCLLLKKVVFCIA